MPTALHQVPDRDLIASFLADGDEQAFTHFVRRYANLVFGVCRRVLGNNSDAEDAAQVVFVVLSQKAAELSDHENITGWLHRVALHVALRHKQAGTRRTRREAVASAGAAIACEFDRDDLHRQELRDVLDSELDQLPEEYRNPIILHYFHGKSQQEAAEQLGWSYGTISGRLNRARVLLKERLERRGLAVSIALLALLFRDANAEVPQSFVTHAVGTVMDRIAGSDAHRAGSVRPRARRAQPRPTSSISWTVPIISAATALLVVLGSFHLFSRPLTIVETPSPTQSGDAAIAARLPVPEAYDWSSGQIADALMQPDGSVLVLAFKWDQSGPMLGVSRYRNGFDSTYGNDGVADIPGCVIGANIVKQSTGAVVVAAYTLARDSIRIVRLDSEGRLDANFGNRGVLNVRIMTSPVPMPLAHIAVDSRDRIIITGQYEKNGAYVARADANGQPDMNFGVEGRVQFQDPTFCFMNWSAVTPDDSIVMACVSSDETAPRKTCLQIMKCDAAGKPATDFGQDNAITTIDLGGLGPGSARPYLQADGKIVVAGENRIDATHYAPYVVRLLADGMVDASFPTMVMEPERTLLRFSVAANGDYLCCLMRNQSKWHNSEYGSHNGASTPSAAEIRRVHVDGSNDRGFGALGTLPLAQDEETHSVVTLANGGFITLGTKLDRSSTTPLLHWYDRTGTEQPAPVRTSAAE
jgi:RNA polymerase sigma factor (sigma-70 family)